jgi:hypothetical protein
VSVLRNAGARVVSSPSTGWSARVPELVAPGAVAGYTLGSSPAKIAYALLGLLGLAVVVYVAVPVLKALGTCWSARIEARLMPPKQQRHRQDRTRRRGKA